MWVVDHEDIALYITLCQPSEVNDTAELLLTMFYFLLAYFMYIIRFFSYIMELFSLQIALSDCFGLVFIYSADILMCC